MCRHRHRRRGFTLIELLVVIAIIAILVALLLPAVQQAREAARRTQCKDHLHNLALALHNYHDVYNQFPLGSVCANDPSSGFGGGGSAPANTCGTNFRHANWGTTWAISLLPYIDQGPLWNQWNSSLPSDQQPQVTGTALAIMKCPSDIAAPPARGSGDPGNGTPGEGALYDKGNYAANYGGGNGTENCSGNGVDGTPSWASGSNLGPFHSRDCRNTRYGARMADIMDGTSNSVALSEILKVANDGDCRGCWGRHMGAYFSAFSVATPNEDGAQWIATPNAPTDDEGGNILFRDAPPYCDNGARKELRCNDKTTEGARGGVVARSRHPGGVHVGLCDGSTKFVNENIDRLVWRSLLTIQGRDVVGEF